MLERTKWEMLRHHSIITVVVAIFVLILYAAFDGFKPEKARYPYPASADRSATAQAK